MAKSNVRANFSFERSLKLTGEVGYVEQVFPSLIYASGLPNIHPAELVVFETGQVGQVLSVNSKLVEILLFAPAHMPAGTQLTRTNDYLSVNVGDELFGSIIDPLGQHYGISKSTTTPQERRYVDMIPSGILDRAPVSEPLETGVSIVDLVIPIGIGQRELVIGDRKSGKTSFLIQTLLNQARKGTICIYALVGKRQMDILKITNLVKSENISDRTIIVATAASDSPGLVFMTPYTAMTVAEYYRDKGKNVLLIIDDLTTHAQFYRELALLARRFPGRNSYPGDIFYIHSRLLERAGSFKKGSISTLVAADTVLGDLSGYIQTNLMAITDGHIFFDMDMFNEGIRPAVNPYLSVTRVGEQTQSPVGRDLSRQLSRFLSHYQRLKELTHFGSEFEQRVEDDLNLGERIFSFFKQEAMSTMPYPISVLLFALLWGGFWRKIDSKEMKSAMLALSKRYQEEADFQTAVNNMLSSSNNFSDLVQSVRANTQILGLVNFG